MYKNIPTEIKKYNLEPSVHKLHKQGLEKSDFGLDSSSELIENGFGLYSSADLKSPIGPIKTQYFRISLIRKGTVTFDIGLETFHPVRNNIVFGFPGQIFSLYNNSNDFFCYYMLFTEEFISSALLMKNNWNQFPFLSYSGVQCFQLNENEANEVEQFIMKMNDEIKSRRSNMSEAIRLYIQLILIEAGRSYGNKLLAKQGTGDTGEMLFNKFIKLVSRDFLSHRKVSDYANLLHISPDHLNRTIKTHSHKTAHEVIDEMILIEAKAQLKHSQLSIAEIAYQLQFSDPSHFNKFFKKLSGCTPLQYRSKSE
ncbi:MAG: helix-turn-helix domain-containing protein [Bacteroidia bacterium]